VAGLVFGVSDGKPAGHVKVTIAGFTNSADGKSTLAGLVLTTRSTKVGFPILIPSTKPLGFDPLLTARFRTSSPTGDVLWIGGQSYSNRILVLLMGPFGPKATAALPQDGRIGKLEIAYLLRQSKLPAFLRHLLG